MAGLRECKQRLPHLLQIIDLLLQLPGVPQGERLDLGTRPPATLPQCEQGLDGVDREPQGPCPLDEAQHVQVTVAVDPVVGEPDFLIEAWDLAVASSATNVLVEQVVLVMRPRQAALFGD
jgi:hypothetical protein